MWRSLWLKGVLLGVCTLLSGSSLVWAETEIRLPEEALPLKAFVPVKASGENLRELPNKIFTYTGLYFMESEAEVVSFHRFKSVADDSALLELASDGDTILFNRGFGKFKNEGSTKNLPVKEQAVALARQHLQNLGLYPNDPKQLVRYELGGTAMGIYRPATDEKVVYEKTVTVRFGRRLAGLPVEGPGSRILVELGADGELEGLVWNWNEVIEQQLSPAQVRSRNSLRQEIQKRLQTLKAKSVKVTKQLYVFYDDGTGNIEPALRVYADLTFRQEDGEVVTSQTDFYVPFLKQPRTKFPTAAIPQPAPAGE